MKSRIIAALTWLLLVIAGAEAQTANRLVIPDITSGRGTTVSLPVVMENTAEVVAVQFTVEVPDGVTLNTTQVTKSERLEKHNVSVREVAPHKYTFIVLSADNDPIRGYAGQLFTVAMRIGERLSEGRTYPMAISEAAMSLRTGENVLEEATAGTIRIARSTDFVVQDVTVNQESASPGDQITVAWSVSNRGELDATGGWHEQLIFVSFDGSEERLLSTIYNESTLLQAGSSVQRSATIALPQLIGIGGDVRVRVRLVANGGSGERAEAQGNNTADSQNLLSISKQLFLQMPAQVSEGNTQTVQCMLNRSGSWKNEEHYSLSFDGKGRISAPSAITIPARQSGAVFYLTVTDNDVLDNDSVVNFTVEGNGYPVLESRLVIVDDEQPDLSLSASKSVVGEGETFLLTITASRAPSVPLIVTLSCEHPQRFSYPRQVTIPAGETTVTAEVTAVNDDVPGEELSTAFLANAPGYNKGDCILILEDDDMPVLELTLTPNKVQENAGPLAVTGTLRRTTNKDSRITVRLSDDSNGGLYVGTREIVLAKGMEEAVFNCGPVDNTLVDGDRTYTVNAAVWLSSCSCSAAGQSAGNVSAQLEVFDDDGPALSLTSQLSTIQEGGKTILTVSRNTSTDQPLTISLSSDYDENLSYSHTVTIPAGAISAQVEVKAQSNDLSGDSHTVVFTAQADGYSSATCWLMVTDQTLPDAIITGISIAEQEVEAGGTATVSVTIKNGGSARMPSHARIHLHIEGENAILRTLYTQEDLSPGSETTITRQVTMNVVPGDRRLYAVVNEEKRFSELSYNNNTSLPKSLRVLSPYKITMDAENALLKPGESIAVTGKAISAHPDSTRLEVYYINEGLRQNFTLVTDADGSFLATIKPYERQTGHFAIGACYPGEGKSEELVGVDVLGLHYTTADTIICDVVLDETYSGSVEIKNPCKATMTAVTAHALHQPEGCRLTFGEIANMEGGTTLKLGFTAIGTELTEGGKPVDFSVEVSSAEGATTTIPFRFFCRSARARLTADTDTVNTSMAKGTIHEYVIEIANHGKEETGTITLDLPKWMAAYTCTQLPSTGVDKTCKVVLRMCPDDDMPLNLPLNGMIGIRCENGEGLAMPYRIVPVDETTGIVEVEVCDIFTYQTAGAPRVEGAMVTLKHAQTGVLLSSGVTGADRQFTTTVQEGRYLLEVESSRHYPYAAYITVDPGQQVSKRVNLSYKAVTVEWNVIQSEVDDSYEIVSTMNFETNVPVPIVVINGPSKVDVDAMAIGESMLLQFTLTNKGLINAEQVRFELPENGDDWTMRALAYDSPFTLAPHEQVVVPVILTRIAVTDMSRAASNKRSSPCLLYPHCMAGLGARYKYFCDEDLIENRAAHIMTMRLCAIAQLLNCIFNGGGGGGGNGGGGGWGDPGGGVGGGSNGKTICDHDYAERMLFASNWALALPTGIAGIVTGAVMTGLDVAFTYSLDGKVDWQTIAEYMLRPASNIALSAYESSLDLAMKPLPWVYEAINTWMEWGNQLLDLARLEGASWVEDFDNQVEKMLKQFTNFDNMLLGIFGSPSWYKELDETIIPFWQYIESKGNVKHTYEELAPLKPDCVTDAELKALIDRANSGTAIAVRGARNSSVSDSIVYYANIVKGLDEEAQAEGYASLSHRFFNAYDEYMARLNDLTTHVCASVKMQIQQVMTMRRPAYRGTLKVFNGHDSTAMSNVRLTLTVEDSDGKRATSREMQVNLEALEGFGGEAILDDVWTLEAQQTGTATVLFIPTKYATPNGAKDYTFGGVLTYTDPFTGFETSMSLLPVQLTVNPLPDLDLTYLMQRDVYGDDPLTENVVEPMEEAEFALIINNKGNGEAKDVRMLTQQPEIIENEKGLLINFDIVSTQVNGKPANLSFGQAIPNDFGTIAAHSQSYGQWWLRSTLLGHFTSYEVEAVHQTSYGNEYLSLIDTVTIHEMIRGFTPYSYVAARAYLVNDIVDADDLPDVVYFTDAMQQPLYIAANATMERQGELEFLLRVTPSKAGWNYGSVKDLAGKRLALVSLVRQRDGVMLPVDNVWQTDRTLRDGRDWLYENRLHFVADLTTADETFLLTFREKTEEELKIEDTKAFTGNGIHFRHMGDMLYVSGNFGEMQGIDIYDLRGLRRVHHGRLQTGQGIYTGGLPAGIYQVVVRTDNGTYRAKVLKK